MTGHNSCQQLHDLLYEFVDESWCGCQGDVDHLDQLTAVMRHHLETCSQCQDSVNAEVHVREVLRRSCLEMAPESLRLSVAAVVRH